MTFEHLIKIKLPEVVLVDAEKFITEESETYFASIGSYIQNRQKISTTDWGSKSIVLCTIHGQISFDNSIEFIESQNGIFPNAEGLAIAAPLLRDKGLKQTAVYGFDKKEKLWEPSGKESLFVPYSKESLFVPYIVVKPGNFYFGLSSFAKNSHIAVTNNSYLIYIAD
jgi:hypothetical protein